jgi:putative endonuclease
MPSAKRRLGAFGESLAQAHLRAAGYTILTTNWRCAAGELDLIAQQGDQVVFVEVRTRRIGPTGGALPEESISAAKAQRLIDLAYHYLAAHEISETTPWRIDLIAIELDAGGRVLRINQIEYAVGLDL